MSMYNEKVVDNLHNGGFMIRDINKQDVDKVMELWLNTNMAAHSFIESEYWISNYENVREMMMEAIIFVYEVNDEIQGFIGLMDNYIAGIFVSKQSQSKGIGKKLLDYVKNEKDALTLSVYKENERAVNFYLRESFVPVEESIDENTGKLELKMSWVRN